MGLIRYKLTDENGNSYGGMHWVPGVTNRATGSGTQLCSDGFIHGYETPEQAAFMRPAHVPSYTLLWEIEVPEVTLSYCTKEGYKQATCIREIPLPMLTIAQCTEIAIRTTLLVYHDAEYKMWAENWINNKDRSANAAANAAADAANAAYAANAAKAAANAVYAAEAAAYAANAANAAADAADKEKKINLAAIIKEVLNGLD